MFWKRNKTVSNGNHIFVKGEVFGPGAEAFQPVRDPLPPIVATGTGYLPTFWGISPVQPNQTILNQQAAFRGTGVEQGNFGATSPLAGDSQGSGFVNNSISQTQ